MIHVDPIWDICFQIFSDVDDEENHWNPMLIGDSRIQDWWNWMLIHIGEIVLMLI